MLLIFLVPAGRAEETVKTGLAVHAGSTDGKLAWKFLAGDK
ncbi:MAG: hypothetical protein QGG42_22000 [Phycisphaerae bacterium]|jgi:hypothetical protein|nr:hypothetical protein [Phycisphaerae bacterium]